MVSGRYPNLQIKDYEGWSNRNQLMIELLLLMFKRYKRHFLNKRIKLIIYTGDRPEDALEYQQLGKIFAFSTTEETQDKVIPIPDFIYIGWTEVGINSWKELISQCEEKSTLSYENPQCFWIGNTKTHSTREHLVELSKEYPELLTAIDMNWNDENGIEVKEGVKASRYVSIPDHANYKSLIDIQGRGWSGRLKLLMHLGRPVFIVKRPYLEFFFPYLEPYKHYIPVKEDLSDLIEQIEWLNNNPSTYDYIAQETKLFAQNFLNKDFAIEQLFNVVYQHGIRKKQRKTFRKRKSIRKRKNHKTSKQIPKKKIINYQRKRRKQRRKRKMR